MRVHVTFRACGRWAEKWPSALILAAFCRIEDDLLFVLGCIHLLSSSEALESLEGTAEFISDCVTQIETEFNEPDFQNMVHSMEQLSQSESNDKHEKHWAAFVLLLSGIISLAVVVLKSPSAETISLLDLPENSDNSRWNDFKVSFDCADWISR